ncbi:hypothetical protein ES705_50132 [subsurface metagenome]
MSWLYNHRDQLDGLYPLAVIAFWAVVSHIPPEDQDDVEQEIVLSLMETIEKYGDKPKSYLEVVARCRVYNYFNKKYREEERLRYIFEDGKGEIIRGLWRALHYGHDDARTDAIATLATLPERLIQIGHKIENGEKLSEADQHYWIRQKAKLRPKLNCRRYANRLSDREKRRILKLHSGGMSMCKIARTMGRSNKAVMRVLAGHQPQSHRDWLAKLEAAAKEEAKRIRHAYFVDRKGISKIMKEFHHGYGTVREAIYPDLRSEKRKAERPALFEF